MTVSDVHQLMSTVASHTELFKAARAFDQVLCYKSPDLGARDERPIIGQYASLICDAENNSVGPQVYMYELL